MANKFKDELIDLWTDFYNTDKIYDLIFVSDDLIEVKCENKKVANEFADYIMAKYNAPICYDFRKGNNCYQFSISPSLMIRESKFESKKSARKSLKEKVTVAKSLKIIEHALLDLIHDDTIQEEFNMAFDDVNGIYDSVDDMFEVSVHNVLNKLLKEHTITIMPF